MKFDVFISHANEDKGTVARPLAEALHRAGVRVWYDEFELRLGYSLSESIDAGLAQSRFGVVITSKHFLEKPWPRRELRGLVSRELISGGKVLLPVWHEVSKQDLMAVSPPLADVLAVSTSRGLNFVAERILEVVRPDLISASSPGGGAEHLINRSGNSTFPGGSLDGDYLVVGRDADGLQYRGRSTVRVHDGVSPLRLARIHMLVKADAILNYQGLWGRLRG